MATKVRNVDVLSPRITVQDGENPVLFEDVLSFMNAEGREYRIGEKSFHVSLFDDPINDECVEGLVITTQDSDIPPKRNKRTGVFSPVQIDTRTEGFAYANVFLYDKTRKVLLYEINKNGCFPRQLTDAIYHFWNSPAEGEEGRTRFDLFFPVFARRDEYNRMLRMNYYKKISVELVNPQGLVNNYREDEDSIENWIRASVATAAQSNANSIVFEQTVFARKENPNGLSHNMVKDIVDKVLARFGHGNIKKLEVQGYTDDAEEPRKCRPVDLLTDAFKESFRIQDIQINTNLQGRERKSGIEGVYERILPEIRQILGQ